MFECIYVSEFFFRLFLHKAEKKGHVILAQVNQELHTGEAAAAWTSLIMLMRSPGYAVIEV